MPVSGFAGFEPLEPRRLLSVVNVAFYEDVNHSGLRENPEGYLAGRTAYLDLNNNGAFDTGEPSGVSGADGRASIDTTTAAPYTLRQIVPDGWTPSGRSFWLVSGDEPLLTYGFGSFVTGSPTPTGSISVFVFDDTNANGIRDAGELPRSNAIVYLDLNNDGIMSNEPSVPTHSDGFAQFNNIFPGTYTVRPYLNHAYFTQSTPVDDAALVVPVGDGLVDAGTIGVSPASLFSRIAVSVFNDANENGIWDIDQFSNANEHSITNQTVYLDANNNGSLDEGERRGIVESYSYWFNSIRPGTYTVRLLPAPSWRQTAPANEAALTVTVRAPSSTSFPGGQFGVIDHEVSPTIKGLFLDIRQSPLAIDVTFSEPVASFDASQVTLHNLTTAQDFTPEVDFNGSQGRIFLKQTVLPDGNYTATVTAAAAHDFRGNYLTAPYTYDFYILKGDLNRDRVVSIGEFIFLSSFFGGPGTPQMGDLNDDGFITISDFIDFAANFGKTLPPPSPLAAMIPMVPASATTTQTSVLITKTKTRYHHRSKHTVFNLLS